MKKKVFWLLMATFMAVSCTACGEKLTPAQPREDEKAEVSMQAQEELTKETENAVETEETEETEDAVVSAAPTLKDLYQQGLEIQQKSEEVQQDLETYNATLNKADEKNENGEVVYKVADVYFAFRGDIGVQSLTSSATPNVFVIQEVGNSESKYGIGVYDKSFNATGYDAIINKNHENTDRNGNKYYTAKDIERENTYYAAFPSIEKFIVINYSGNMSEEMLDMYIDAVVQ